MNSQDILISDDVTKQLKQMGYTQEQIILAFQAANLLNDQHELPKYLKYAASKYNELYQIVHPNQTPSKNNQSFQNHNSSVQKLNSTKIQTRNPQIPIGLVNIGNICYFNSLLQLMLNNPVFIKTIFQYNVQYCNDKYDNFLNSLQKLFANLLVSNKSYYDASEVLQFMFWDSSDIKLVGNQQDFRELCELFLQRVDQSLQEKRQISEQPSTILNVNDLFKTQILNQQFVLADNYQKSIVFISADLRQSNIYNSLYNLFGQQQNQLTMPDNLFFQISRYSYDRNFQNVVKLTQDFALYPEIYIDFILQNIPAVHNLFNSFMDYLNNSKQSKIQQFDHQKIQKQIESFQDTIKYYQDKQDYIIVEKLTQDLNMLLYTFQIQSVERNYEWLHQQLSQFCSMKYYLHSIVIHQGRADQGHYFIYIYNFSKKQWFQYNDSIVEKVCESDVFRISKNNGYIVTYVSESQRQLIKQQEDIIDLICQNDLSSELYENLELLQMIPYRLFQEIYSQNLNLTF